MKIIAHIYTDFTEKFGIPRQSGLVEEIKGRIVFEPEYRNTDAVRGLEEFSHIWVLWQFSECIRENWSPTVRPPLLGGNKRVGVFATRSPFRPNPIGLSSLRLEKIEEGKNEGPVLIVSGCDLMNGTPVYDIKPYLPYTDCHTDAVGGFTENLSERHLEVVFSEGTQEKIDKEKCSALISVLSHDPRPSYQKDPERIYTFSFGEYEVSFRVEDKTLKVVGVERLRQNCRNVNK